MRLDAYLVEAHFASGRDRAKEMIAKGTVLVDGQVCGKPSTEVEGKTVTVTETDDFVGRGAHKLEKAFAVFELSVKGLCCLDAGASTGGFTQFLLKEGAWCVYAVDVGSGQLAAPLKNDPRVVNLEKTDIRRVVLPLAPAFFSADVSFISLTQILPALFSLTSEDATGVCLIKPQFEVGRASIGKRGVVRSKAAHQAAIEAVCAAARACAFLPSGLTYSPLLGQNGNIEYLLQLKKQGAAEDFSVADCINKAWEDLG